MNRRIVPLLASLGVLLVAGPAAAEIDNFSFLGIEGLGALDGNLDERLGTSVGDNEHIINLADCRAYAGGRSEWTVQISSTSAGDWIYGLAYSAPGKTCDTADAKLETSDSCFVVASEKELDATELTIEVDFDELMGGDCETGDEGTAIVYVIIQEPTLNNVQVEQLEVTVDLEPPVAPVIDSVTPGDRRFTVDWSDDLNSSDEVTYTVYYDEVDFTADALATVSSEKDIQTTSIAIESSSLVNDLTYYVRVAAVDEADNESGLSDTLTVTPIETEDFWEHYQATGGTDPGGFCFVATAAYGSPLAGELGTLRAFRDRVLMSSSAGRAFVDGYYRYGRFAAAWIADKPALRAVVRVLLVPLLWLAKLALWLTPLGALALLFGGAMGLARLRRRWLEHILRDVPLEAR